MFVVSVVIMSLLLLLTTDCPLVRSTSRRLVGVLNSLCSRPGLRCSSEEWSRAPADGAVARSLQASSASGRNTPPPEPGRNHRTPPRPDRGSGSGAVSAGLAGD